MTGNDNTRPFYPDYGRYTGYEKKIIKRRARQLTKIYINFKETLEDIYGADNCKFEIVDPPIFYQICGLYANDIKEARVFHKIKGPSKYRRAAYIARLISNYRPIQPIPVLLEGSEVDAEKYNIAQKAIRKINQLFASRVFFIFLELDEEEMENIPDFVDEQLGYILDFRDPQKEFLVLLGKLLKSHLEDKKLIKNLELQT